MIGRIHKLKDTCLRTPLDEAVLIVSDRAGYEPVTRQIRKRLGPLTVCRDTDATPALVEGRHLIAIGNLCTNKLIERLYYQWYTNVDVGYPGREGHVVRSIHDPWGAGRNVILVGGSDDQGVAAAAESFLGAVRSDGPNASVAWLGDIRLGDEARRQMESRPHYRGPICDLGFKYYFSGEERYGGLWREELLKLAALPDPYQGSHIWAWSPLALWDLLEESPIFSDADRLLLTNLFLGWVVSDEVYTFTDFRRDLRDGNLTQPHRTGPALACFFGGRYFKKYYGMKEANSWLAAAKKYFEPQMSCSKTLDEPEACTAESLGAGGLFTYAVASGDHRCFENGIMRQAADRVAMCCNNLGVMAAFADTQSFNSVPGDFFSRLSHRERDGGYEFMARRKNPWRDECKPVWREYENVTPTYHTDVQPHEPTHLLGVKVAPLSRTYWDKYRGDGYTFPEYPKTIPHETSFDKITFRGGFDAEDDYLLLDGVSGGVHGFADANSILEYTSRGRLWIVTADLSYGYDNSRLSQHNAVTVLRDGLGQLPPGFAAIVKVVDERPDGFTHTVLPGHNGVDWHRTIAWPGDHHFVVTDELHVTLPGEYRFDCRWRTLGEPRWGEQSAGGYGELIVEQKDLALHIACGGHVRMSLERDAQRGSYFSRWAKRKYEYAEPILNILTQTIEGKYQPGDVVRFVNRIHIAPSRMIPPAGGGGDGLKKHAFAAPIHPAGINDNRLVQCWSYEDAAQLRDIHVATDGVLVASQSGQVISLDFSGNKQWSRDLRSPVNTIATGDINGDGMVEIVAGTDDARVHAMACDGNPLWDRPFATPAANCWGLDDASVVRVRCVDVDADGCAEIVAGLGDMHLHVLRGDGQRPANLHDWARIGPRQLPAEDGPGSTIWRRFGWGIWNTFDFADVDGDGRIEIIAGPGMPPRAAASPAVILRAVDGELLAELDVDGWAGGLNAIAIEEVPAGEMPRIAIGTIKGNLRVYQSSRQLGKRTPLKHDQAVIDHTSGSNRYFLLEPPRLLWERNLGDLVTGIALLRSPQSSPGSADDPILLAGSTTGYVTAFDLHGNGSWFQNLHAPITRLAVFSSSPDGHPHIVAACNDGELWILNPGGTVNTRCNLGGSIERLAIMRRPDGSDRLLCMAANRVLCLGLQTAPTIGKPMKCGIEMACT
ncbi:MAG: hypothetical protein IT446_09980 [Phycisphaerales bacterium]|nr:hypothetical protein [Phycisphaerales bacterium]